MTGGIILAVTTAATVVSRIRLAMLVAKLCE